MFNDLGHQYTDIVAVTETKGIGLTQRLAQFGITEGRTFIGPDKYVFEQRCASEFVDPQQSLNIQILRDVDKGKRRQVPLVERNIRRQPRYPFIDIIKGLQIGKLYYHEESLLKWILDLIGLL